MDFKRLASYAVTLLLGLALGYFLTKGVNTKPTAINAVNLEKDNKNDERKSVDTTLLKPNQDTTSPSPEPSVDEEPVPPQPTNPSPNRASTSLTKPTLCYDQNDQQFRQDLLRYTQGLERDSIWYKQRKQGEPDLLEDCSGIFHRVKNHFASKCDAYQYPDVGTTRDTRALAAWFKKQENLIIVTNPAEQRNLIVPGTVMFFGISGEVYNNLNVERVLAPRPNHTIMHVGIVTDVEKDAEGNVARYTMFHGRSEGKVASSTYYHKLAPPRPGFPAFGNWDQQLVAMASLMTPKQ